MSNEWGGVGTHHSSLITHHSLPERVSAGDRRAIARALSVVERVLDAAGFEIVVVETIGVGQDEIDVGQAVETLVLVEAPNLGDDVQTLKAGLLEVADVVVVGRADQPGADRALATLRAAFRLAPG